MAMEEVHFLTRAEAVKLVSRAPSGTEFAVHLRFDCPRIMNGGHMLPVENSGHSWVDVSRKDAKRIVSNLIEAKFEDAGGRIRMKTIEDENSDRTIWIG